jgi:holliday junction DNA helicase RuvA
MIGYIEGKVIGQDIGESTILAGGIGYDVRHTSDTSKIIKSDSVAKLWVHHVVREDDELLYGFTTLDERALFRHLLSVNSVGPKTALHILNLCGYETLRKGIASQDPTLLTEQGGLGKKTAEKIVFGLKDIFETEEKTILSEVENEVADALIALGYKAQTVKEVLKKIEKNSEGASVSDTIKQALRLLQ